MIKILIITSLVYTIPGLIVGLRDRLHKRGGENTFIHFLCYALFWSGAAIIWLALEIREAYKTNWIGRKMRIIKHKIIRK